MASVPNDPPSWAAMVEPMRSCSGWLIGPLTRVGPLGPAGYGPGATCTACAAGPCSRPAPASAVAAAIEARRRAKRGTDIGKLLARLGGSGGGVVGEGQQAGRGAVEDVLVTGEEARVGELPEGVEAPAGRKRPDGAAVAGDPQRVVVRETAVVAGAGRPPVGGGVDDRPAAGPRAVGVDEVGDPRPHRALAQPVAGRAVRVVLDVERAGQRAVVSRPGAAVGGEEVRLRGAACPVGQREVVRPADQ